MKLFKSKKIPAYSVETPAAQLRHIRTHIAAQAGEISSVLTQVGMLRALFSQHDTETRAELAEQRERVTLLFSRLKHEVDNVRTRGEDQAAAE